MGFKNFLREYFTFNRRQRNGVFILLSIIMALILYLSFSDRFFSPEKTDFSRFENDIEQFEAELRKKLESAEDTATIIRWISEKVLESYKNGITAGRKGATVIRHGQSRRKDASPKA